jgi:hypothetical protein
MRIILLFISLVITTAVVLYSIGSGKTMTVKIIMVLPVIAMMLYFVSKNGLFSLLQLSIVFFWFPLAIGLKSASYFLSNIYIVELMTYMAIIIVFMDSSVRRKMRVQSIINHYPFYLFLLYFLGAYLAHLNSGGHSQEMPIIRGVYLWPGVFIFTVVGLATSKERISKLILLLLISGAVLSLVVLFGDGIGIGGKMHDAQESVRLSYYVSLPFVGKMHLHMSDIGVAFGVLLIISFSIYLIHPLKKYRIFSLAFSFLFLSLILKAQSRGAIIGIFLAIIMVIYLSKKGKIIQQTNIIIKGSIIAFLLVMGFWYLSVNSVDADFAKRSVEFFEDPFEAINFLNRIEIWYKAFKLIFSSFFGYGLHGFPLSSDGNTGIVHNIFLYHIFATGFIGFFAFIFILFKTFRTCLFCISRSNEPIYQIVGTATIGVLIVWLVAGLVDPIHLKPWEYVIFWFTPALAFSVTRIIRTKKRSIQSTTINNLN